MVSQLQCLSLPTSPLCSRATQATPETKPNKSHAQTWVVVLLHQTSDIRLYALATLTWGPRDKHNWETYPKQRRGVSPAALSYVFKTQVSSLHQGEWSLPKCLKWHQLFLQPPSQALPHCPPSSSNATRELPAPLGTAPSGYRLWNTGPNPNINLPSHAHTIRPKELCEETTLHICPFLHILSELLTCISDTISWRHDRITLYTALVPEQESRQSKGKHQESNPETDSLPQCQVCAALSLAYHTLRVTWAAKCADLPGNWKNSRLAPRDTLCNKAGKGVGNNCRKLFLGQSWRKNWACPMTSACHPLDSDSGLWSQRQLQRLSLNSICFSVKRYSCKKMRTTLRRGRSTEKDPRVLSPHVQPDVSVWRYKFAQLQRSSMQLWRTQMHYLQRWQMYWANLTTFRYKSHQGFFGVVWFKNKTETSFKITYSHILFIDSSKAFGGCPALARTDLEHSNCMLCTGPPQSDWVKLCWSKHQAPQTLDEPPWSKWRTQKSIHSSF